MGARFGTALIVGFVAGTVAAVPVPAVAAGATCNGAPVTISGSPGRDRLRGTARDDVIHAGAGDDVVLGRGGNDLVCGGAGDDRVFGDDDVDVVAGGPGNDFLDGGPGHDVASYASAERGVRIDLRGPAANGEGHDSLDGIESAAGGGGDDVIVGTRRANLLVGGSGDDHLFGLDGPDVLEPLEGEDVADGGAGEDLVSYSLSLGAVAIDPRDGDGTERLRSFEALQGSPFPDVITGTRGDDVLLGHLGGDELHPRGGDDVVDGEGPPSELDEVVYADEPRRVSVDLRVLPDAPVGLAKGHGKDALVKIDHAVGSRYDDVLVGRGARDVLVGLAGDDRIRVGTRGTGIGGPGDDVLVGTGRLFGDGGDDVLRGARELLPAHLEGGRGHDDLTGGPGADFFVPGPGDDEISGGEPSSTVGSGSVTLDRVSYATAEGAVAVDLTAGVASGEGDDRLDGVEDVEGSAFDDVVGGSDSQNYLVGGDGDDRLDGLAAGDLLHGGSGDDVLTGGDGDDTLAGEDGTDAADGGPGTDACEAEQSVGCENTVPSRRGLREVGHPAIDGKGVASAASPIWALTKWMRFVHRR